MSLYTEIYGTGVGDGALSQQRLAQLTNQDSPSKVATSINTSRLQQAVFYAQATFQNLTATLYDDVTVNLLGPPLVVNRCHPVGIALVIAWLYRLRGFPEEAATTKAAWEEALYEVKAYMISAGGGSYGATTSDSQLQPSQQQSGSLPAFDDQSLGRIVPNGPNPSSRRSSGSINQWNGGG